MATLPLPEDDGDRFAQHMAPNSPDLRLAYRVAHNLLCDDRLRHERIALAVQNRVVILTGNTDVETRDVVDRIVRDSEGVHDVCNLIRVRGPDASPFGASQADRERQRFDAIVAGLRSAEPTWEQQFRAPSRARVLTLTALLLVLLWSVLLVALVEFGWPAIAVAVTAGALSLVPLHLLRRRRPNRR